MVSHVIAFQAPTAKVYDVLPPSVEDMDEVLAILFTGPIQPTEKDFARTPLLVRRNKVIEALEWLKLNHRDYADIEISLENMNEYPEHCPPVIVQYKFSETNKIPETQDLANQDTEDGVDSGPCPFAVHGLTGEAMLNKTSEELKSMALKHMNSGGKMLAVGHSPDPQNIYHNPRLYPQMFPWLFPYGYGGIGSLRYEGEDEDLNIPKREIKISEAEHKRHLLMYHDKRFQTDIYFPFVAFSHEQIKAATTGGFLATEKGNFDQMTERLLNLNPTVLTSLSNRLAAETWTMLEAG
ncbi:hypothetical protein BDN72DRAFT_907568 [Pluteus cervinus]|uniref:Uncharacterized protein n=1 Tax=Pluteus cervinus TaxID=181527 RepID=A0ACD2ZWK6_9AGAR|nr:hypothetical protein BDN72DRAFT_907568 [Pluteus cervinus]